MSLNCRAVLPPVVKQGLVRIESGACLDDYIRGHHVGEILSRIPRDATSGACHLA